MATLLKPWYVRPVPTDATPTTHKGKPAIRFKGNDGKPVVGLLMPNKPGHCRVQMRTWYAQFRNANGKKARVSLETTNKEAAQRALAKLIDKESAKKLGIHDPFVAHAAVELATHLDDWKRFLAASDTTLKHRARMVRHVEILLAKCRFVFLADLSASRVQDYLAELREPQQEIAVPEQADFTLDEAAAVLGIQKNSILYNAKRRRLTVTGTYGNKRCPRATVVAMANIRQRGASATTANHVLIAIRAFTKWLVNDRRLASNPFGVLQPGDAERDRRRERRFFTLDESRRLIQAARNSTRVHGGRKASGKRQATVGLNGSERALLYATAIHTGYRAGELAELLASSFELDGPTPLARLDADHTKNRKAAAQAIPQALADELRTFLATKAKSEHVWPGKWHERAAEMIRRDMQDAGIPYEVLGDNGQNLVADFHSLRSTCGILAEAGGASLRETMNIMRHSDPKLTMKVYGRLQVHDLASVVHGMPSVLDAPLPETKHAPNMHPNMHPNEMTGDTLGMPRDGKGESDEQAGAMVESDETPLKSGENADIQGITDEEEETVGNSPDVIRTRDRRIRKQLDEIPNPLPVITSGDTGNEHAPKHAPTGTQGNERELATIAAAWESLAPEVRAAMLALAHQQSGER